MAYHLVQRRLGRRLLLGAPLVLAACSARGQEAEVKFERSSLVIVTGGRDVAFDVELAVEEEQRTRGLMYRKSLGPYEGMLFDFHKEAEVAFWMKNTLISLDMVFIAADGTVRHVHANAEPLSTRTIPSKFPVQGVLEINGGTSLLLGIKPGDKVKHAIFGTA